ncbi:MAG: NAD+ synthase [Candidatus Diapherotrites archaeon]|nr:NAD+ synthase [Candidatus Diapherotrites archaeon]
MSTTRKHIVKGIKEYFRRSGKTRAVLGLSGGIDSAVVAVLLVQALGKKNVTCLLLPTPSSSAANLADARAVAKQLGVRHFIQPIYAFTKPFTRLPWKQTKITTANLKARIRATILYHYANTRNALVVGTGNRTELMLGYFTKYGDGAVDLLPIGGLWKREVRALARELKVPAPILEKAPTAELWPGQTDERELGLSYTQLDAILSALFDRQASPKQVIQEGFSRRQVEKVLARVKANQHKAVPPPIIAPNDSYVFNPTQQ